MLVLSGGAGTGKSHLLQAIGWELLGKRHIRYVYTPDWLSWLRRSFSNDTPEADFESMYQAYAKVEVLLLDDLGAEKATDWTIEVLGRVVDKRYRDRLPLVVATNKCPTDPDVVRQFGFRLADRLFDTGSGRVQVVDTGTISYRTGRR